MAEYEHLEELVVGLYDRNMLRFGELEEFEINSGRAPVFYDQDAITSFRKGLVVHDREVTVKDQKNLLNLAIEGFAHKVDEVKTPYQHMFGMPQSFTSFGILVAREFEASYLWGRIEPIINDPKRVIVAGEYNPEDAVVNLDNALTTGGEFRRLMKPLEKKRQLVSIGLVSMLEREEGGRRKLRKDGYEVFSVFKLSRAMQILSGIGRIGTKEVETVAEYHEGLRSKGVKSTFNIL